MKRRIGVAFLLMFIFISFILILLFYSLIKVFDFKIVILMIILNLLAMFTGYLYLIENVKNTVKEEKDSKVSDLYKKLREAEFQLEEIRKLSEFHSISDSLLPIYNRKFILQKLEEEMKRSKRYRIPLSIILAYIDNFKFINDTYGQKVGDGILKGVNEIIQYFCRETDIIGRFGGQTFLLILPQTDGENAVQMVERIRKKAQDTIFTINRNEIKITLSFGLTSLSELILNTDQFLLRANEALDISKKRDGNQVTFL
ncbi:MAG: GGDEF domain-containing protein [Acidobacteriota bacterium]